MRNRSGDHAEISPRSRRDRAEIAPRSRRDRAEIARLREERVALATRVLAVAHERRDSEIARSHRAERRCPQRHQRHLHAKSQEISRGISRNLARNLSGSDRREVEGTRPVVLAQRGDRVLVRVDPVGEFRAGIRRIRRGRAAAIAPPLAWAAGAGVAPRLREPLRPARHDKC